MKQKSKIYFNSFFSIFICDVIKGILGAKKYPVKLANKIGIKYENPVKVINKIVVLIGVRVTQAFIAAIQLTTVKDRLMDGIKW